jgi:hypothetical protein
LHNFLFSNDNPEFSDSENFINQMKNAVVPLLNFITIELKSFEIVHVLSCLFNIIFFLSLKLLYLVGCLSKLTKNLELAQEFYKNSGLEKCFGKTLFFFFFFFYNSKVIY